MQLALLGFWSDRWDSWRVHARRIGLRTAPCRQVQPATGMLGPLRPHAYPARGRRDVQQSDPRGMVSNPHPLVVVSIHAKHEPLLPPVRSCRTAESAGGGPSSGTYASNPTYELTVPYATQLKCVVSSYNPFSARPLPPTDSASNSRSHHHHLRSTSLSSTRLRGLHSDATSPPQAPTLMQSPGSSLKTSPSNLANTSSFRLRTNQGCLGSSDSLFIARCLVYRCSFVLVRG